MPWNEIKLNISANMDFGDAKQQISTIKQGIDGLKTSISEMPNVSKILDNSFERSVTVVDALNDKLEKLQNKTYSSDAERVALERGANNNILELNALRDVQLGTTSYSAQIAKQWFGDLPSAVQHQFDTIAPQLTSIVRSRISSLSKAGSSILSKDVGQIAKELTGGTNPTKMDPAIRGLLNKHGLSNTDAEFNLDRMIEYLIPSITPANMNKIYQKARYGHVRQNVSAGLYTGKPEDLFPESFKATFRSQGRDFQTFDKSYQSMVLDTAYRKQLDNILKNNSVAVKAAIASGISRRDERGVLETKDEISRSEWEGFRKALYDDLLVRVSGYKGNAIDAYKATGSDKRTLMQRLTSSTSGRAMLAMQDIEGMEDTRAWTNSANPNTWSKLQGEGKRIQDQLVVSKYSPFTGDKVALGDPRSVMISESHNTRLLGGGKWKNNQDVSDTIRIVSLAGYDAKNPEHQKFLENLFNPNGAQLGNAKFIAQSIHGTGQDTIVRMIEQNAFNRVNEQEAEWIRNHPDEAVRGIRGTYWRGFDDAEIDRLIQNGVGGKDGITAQKYGKHLEMLNKAWTNTSDLGINIDGKRFAVVDTSRLKDQLGGVSPGDGGAFFASSVMPHSGQFRGGVGLKGSAFVFEGNDLRAFGKKTGLLDEQGRLMAPGPNGELFNIADYQGYIPMDVIKNQGVLKDENGNYVSGDIASRRFTALLQRHPMSYHADYDLDQVASDNLGTQMSSFMMFSPELRQHQIEMAMRRMQELDTEEGQLKYVFGNKEDYLSRKVNPLFGGNSQLLASTEARSRIDNMRASLYNDLIAGKYINFDNDDKIANLRAAASPLATILLAKDGTVPDASIAKARSYLDKEANARLSDQDIRDMIILPQGKVLDFNRKDQANVAVVRSPTGYGNMYYAQNLAADAEPIYKGFGISTSTGMYVSEKDRRILQGMDYDADQVKAIYDKELADAVQASLKRMGAYKDSDVKGEDIVYTPEQLKSWSVQNRLQAERNLYATMPMGTGSSGIRIMQVDYSRPENQALVYAAQRMAGIYDIGSTPKKAQTYTLEKDDPVWAALGLGKEYTKFSEKRTDLFKFDEDMIVSPDRKNAVKTREGTYIDASHPDIYKASNGEYINLRALRDMGIDEINLPSRYMSNHMMAIAQANQLYRTGNVDPTQMDAIYEAMDKQLGYGDAGPERIKLMQTMRMLHHQFGTGERAYITNDEGQYIQGLINAAAAELTLAADDYRDPTTGKFMLGDKAYDTKEQWAKAQEARYGIRTARNAIDQFGMLESDLVRTYGDDFRTNFVNATDAVGQTLVSKVVELRKQAEAFKEPEQPKEPAKPETAIVANNNIIRDEKGNIVYEDKNTGNLVYVENPKASGSASMPIQGGTSTNQSESADAIWGPQTPKKAEQTEQREKVLADLSKYEHALEVGNRFNQILSDTRTYGDELWREQRGKENKLNDEKTLAERQYNYLQYRTFENLQPLNALEEELASDAAFTGTKDLEDQRSAWMSQIAQARDKVTENMHKSFTNGIMLDAKQLEDDITKELNGFGLSKQKETLNKYDERISKQQNGITWMQNRLDKGLVDSAYQKQYEDAIKVANQRIANAQDARASLAAEYTTQNETAGRLALESLQIKQGLKSKNSLSVISAARKQEINTLRKQVGNQYNEGQYSKNEYDRINEGLDQLERRANPAMIALGQGAKILKTEFKSTFGYMSNMFTRRLFQSAISETTNFVKQFDASMNTIQMITLKTDEQISTLGDTLIDKAKEMKVSVAEITQSAATLYRQGLSDQEVDERLGVISKFSKVSGTKVDAATKLITVAMNTGLVSQAEQAADIVTALGDNAATNAAEIEKGIEKAGAAAAADGTTFAQLSAMLTAITSTTQIGGNVAGRTLNTIFGRMNKIGTNELIYDENGNAVSGSAVAKLLEEEGIRMYDEYGNKRSSFDTLFALSQKWESLSDAKQQQFANAIAGTRQYSNFAAIMSGMSEGKVGEYLQLAGESEGITDRKYEIYTKSLNASLTDLRNTWDGLVHDMTDSGALTGGLGFLTNFIEGIDKANNSLGGLGVTLAGILPSLMIMGGLKSGSLVGAGVAAAGLGIAAIVSAIGNQKSSEEQYQEIIDNINNRYNSRNEEVEKARTLFNKGDNRSEEEEKEYDRLLRNLSITVESGDLDTVNKQTNEQRRQNAENIIQQASDKNDLSRVREMIRNRNKTNKLIEDEINKAVREDEENEANLGSQALQTLFAGEYNTETMNALLREGKGAPTYVQGQLLNLYNEISSSDAFEKIKRDYNVSDENLKNAFINSWNNGGWHTDFASGSATDALYTLMQDYWSHTYTPTVKRQTVAKENYIQYLSDMALPLDENEIEALAEDLTNRYLENGGDFFSYISDALSLSQDNYTIDSIAESARNRLKEIGYNKNEKAKKFESANLDYIQNGYYYDNKTGQYLTSEQAEKQIDTYNDRITKFEKAYNDIEAEYRSSEGISEEDQKKAINKLNNKLYSAGIKFTGNFFDFMNNTTDDLVNFIEDLEAPEQSIKPDFSAYKDHFRAQAQSTYNTWESKNQLPLIATRMYEMILDNGLNDLQSLYDYVVKEDIGNWEILNQSEDFAKLALRIQRDETSGKILNGDELYQQYIDALLSTSGEYNQRNLSNVEKGDKLSKAIDKLEDGYYLSYDLQQKAIDIDYQNYQNKIKEQREKDLGYAKDTPEAIQQWNAAHPFATTRDQFIKESGWIDRLEQVMGEDEIALVSEIAGANIANKYFRGGKDNLNRFESAYMQEIISNLISGQEGLTKTQQLAHLSELQTMSDKDLRTLQKSPEILKAYGYSDIEKYITARLAGEAANQEQLNIIENFNRNLEEETTKYNFKFSEDKNASKLLQNYIAWTEGSLTERMGMINPYIQQQKSLANAQAALNAGVSTAEDRNALASILGLEDKDIKDLIKSDKGKQDLQKMLNDKTGKMIEEFAKSFSINLSDANWADQLRAKVLAEQPELYDSIDSLIGSLTNLIVDAEGHVVSAEINGQRTTQAGDYYEQGLEDYEKQTRTARAASWIQQYQDEINKIVNSEYDIYYDSTGRHSKQRSYADALNEIAKRHSLDPAIMAEYWNATRVGLNEAAPDLLELYDNAQISGGKYKYDLNRSLLSRLFGENVNDLGKFDKSKIDQIGASMLAATKDTESGTYTLWSILANNYSELQDALQAFSNNDLTSAQKALDEFFKTFDSERLDEMLKYTEVSKDFKEILVDLGKGGIETELAMVELDATLSQQYNELVALNKVKDKAGKQIKGDDRSYFLSATGLKKADLDNLTKEQVSALAAAQEKKNVQNIQNELVALVESSGAKIDYSKIIFKEDGTIDLSSATEGLEQEFKDKWSNIESILNKVVKDDYIKVNFPILFGLAGYDTGSGNIEKLVDKKELKNAKKILTDTLDKLYEIMPESDRSKVKFNTDLTIDTSNLKSDQAKVVEQWNTYCKENPLVASVAVAAAGGDTVKAQSVIASGGYKTYGEAFANLINMDKSKLQQLALANEVAVAMTGKTSYTKKSSGGGVDPLTKLLKEIEFKMKELEHERKMTQIEQATANRLNNRDAFVSSIDNEVAVIEKMRAAQTENIAKMEEQQNGLDKTSDKYMQLTEKINAAKESLANYNNEIAEAKAKRIEFVQETQEETDKSGTHKQNMLSSYAERALAQDRFSDYVQLTEQKMSEIQTQRTENDAQIEEWKNELKQWEADSDQWREVRDKIYALEEENAELDNQLVQEQLELNQQKLSQIAKILQQDTQTANHNQNIASAYGNFYQSSGYRNEYENMIREQQKSTAAIIAENMKAEASARKQMETLEEGSTSWYEAQAAVYQYSEAVAQAELSQIELNKALTQSNIDKINEDYSDQTRELSHVNELLSQQAQEYLSLKDNEAYMEAMSRYMDNLGSLTNEAKEKLDALNKTYQEGMASKTLDPETQRQLLDAINEAESEYQKFLLEQSQKQREINKVALDKLFEDQDWGASEYDHNIKLLGYQTSVYQNNGELTNVNTMIEEENNLRGNRVKVLQDEIIELEKQKELFKDDQEQEKRIVEQIKKHEEAIEQENTQIDKNNKLLEENKKKIMQVRKTLEDAVDKEIEAEKKRQREILSANVSMQDTIVNLLKKRLQDEWNLKKKDIEKEKENLAEYKSLINERFNYRKKASEQADKDEELAEYRQQLALIEADPTRTKDAKELRRKIEELEKENAWTVAEDEVAAESERIDDQMEGMDKFVQYNEELLNEILGDANNFATEMNEILSGSFEESYNKILEFMSKENEAFMKSLPDAQKQMIQGWEDTWKKANDIIDSNYQLITTVLSDKDTYMDYMRSIDRTYRLYEENGDKNSMRILEQQWGEYYDNYINSVKTGAEFDEHTHTLTDVVSKIDELEDNIFKVDIKTIDGKAPDVYGLDSSNVSTIDFSTGEGLSLADLSGLYYVAPTVTETSSASAADSGNGDNGGPGAKKYTGVGAGQKTKEYATEKEALEAINEQLAKEDVHGAVAVPIVVTSQEEADKIIGINNKVNEESRKTNQLSEFDKIDQAYNATIERANKAIEESNKVLQEFYEITGQTKGPHANGGLIDYTGLAWVDGTMQRPESFLDSTDTKLLRSMLDTFTYVKNSPYMSYIDPSMYNNNTNVGDINITINQAEINSDADVDNLAKRVGQAFTKELQRNGLNLSGYAFG